MGRCDAIRDQGEALQRKLGLAVERIQNAVVIENGLREFGVRAEAEFSAAFQSRQSSLVLMEPKLAQTQHSESGTRLAVFDNNEVLESGAGFAVVSSVVEDGSQIPPAFRPGRS